MNDAMARRCVLVAIVIAAALAAVAAVAAVAVVSVAAVVAVVAVEVVVVEMNFMLSRSTLVVNDYSTQRVALCWWRWMWKRKYETT